MCWSAAKWRKPPKKGAGPARCAPTRATGGTRSTSCASRFRRPPINQSIDRAGNGARRRPVGAGDVEAEEHDLGAMAGKRSKTGDVLGDQHAVAEQRVVHRKGEIRRPPAG